jgi:hypothetical protein
MVLVMAMVLIMAGRMACSRQHANEDPDNMDSKTLAKQDDYYYDDEDYNDDLTNATKAKTTTSSVQIATMTTTTTTMTTTTTTPSPLYKCPKRCQCKTVLDHHHGNSANTEDYEDDYNYDVDDKNYDDELKQYRIDIDCSNSNLSMLKNMFDDNFPFENIRKL